MDNPSDQNKLRDNLNLLMEEKNVSAIHVARETNLPLSSIKKIRNGSNPNPTIATLLPIARYFKISLEELVDANLVSAQSKLRNKKKTLVASIELSVIKWDEILHWPSPLPINEELICTELQISKFSFATRVEADDWNCFTAGSLLLVDPIFLPSHRDYAIVYKPGMSRPSLKQILIEEEKVFLQSVSISNNLDLLTDEYQILGIVIESRQPLKRNPLSKKLSTRNMKSVLSSEMNPSENYI